jgi:hypothetical protein
MTLLMQLLVLHQLSLPGSVIGLRAVAAPAAAVVTLQWCRM